jgi:hypothetical protein
MGTYIVGAIVIGLMILAAYRVFKNYRNGGCGGGCDGCPQAKNCHRN